MPFYTWVEDNSSRSATIHRLGRKATSNYVKSWKIFGATDDVAVHADVNATLWNQYMFWQYPGQPQNRLQAESYTLDYLGDNAWQLQVTYTKDGAEDDEQRNPMKRSRSFDTGGGTQHITQGLPVGGFLNPDFEFRFPDEATNQSGAIAADGSNVQGVDIVVPQLTWTETYDVPSIYVSTPYIKLLSGLTGTVNDAAFRSFAAGEVLFMGASGSQQWDDFKGDGPWSLAYKFVAAANQGAGQTFPAIQIGNIMNIQKAGHDYLWVRYEDKVESNSLIKHPKAVYVNRVYQRVSFALLGIGVSG